MLLHWLFLLLFFLIVKILTHRWEKQLIVLWCKGTTLPLLVGVWTYTITVEISAEFPPKFRNWPTSMSGYTTLQQILNGCFMLPEGLMISYVQCSFSYNKQKLEITKMSVNWIIDKENVSHLHHWVLFSITWNLHIKRWTLRQNHPEGGMPHQRRLILLVPCSPYHWRSFLLKKKWIKYKDPQQYICRAKDLGTLKPN